MKTDLIYRGYTIKNHWANNNAYVVCDGFTGVQIFMVMEEDFKISGDVASIDLPTGSGKGYNAYFCIICGVYVFCRYNISKGRIAIRTQTLEKPI